MTSLQELTSAAETEWLSRWTTGPTEGDLADLPSGSAAPDLLLPDHTGRERRLSEYWSGQPALLMFWRHFACGCGFERSDRGRRAIAIGGLGLTRLLLGGATSRVRPPTGPSTACRATCCAIRPPRLSHVRRRPLAARTDTPRRCSRAVGAPARHRRELPGGAARAREATGRRPVAAIKEFVIGANGIVRLTYAYQHCEDFPNTQVLLTSARLS